MDSDVKTDHSSARSSQDRPLPQLRVLVADDEHLVALGLANLMLDLGHEIVGVAADGAAAMDLAKTHRPDLALLDIKMPNMEGVEAAAKLFQDHATPSVIVSAYSDEEHLKSIREGGDECGVYGYLLKPVSRDSLRVAIDVAIQRWSSERDKNDRIRQLEKNLANRRLIEQAKWRLVERSGFTEPQAHEKMQKSARNKRLPLAQVAQQVLDSEDPGALLTAD